MRSTPFVAMSFLGIALAGCGGGGGDGSSFAPSPAEPVVDSSPGGVWRGTLSSVPTNRTLDLLGVITEDGEARLVTSAGSQLFGTVSVSDVTVTGMLTGITAFGSVWPDGETVGNFTIDATVVEREVLSGSYEGAGDEGTFSLAYDPVYERGSALTLTAGTWISYGEFQNVVATLTVDADGAINGSDVEGCVYSGSVSVTDPEYDVYGLSVDLENCGTLNGNYTGLGVLSDELENSQANDVFAVGVTSSTVAITLDLFKL